MMDISKTGIMGNLNEARCLTGPTNNTDNAYDTSEAWFMPNDLQS